MIKKIRDLIPLLFLSPGDRKLVLAVIRRKLTYLTVRRLVGILKTAKALKKAKREGIYIEAGCALGGSSILLSRIKDKDSKLCVYDVFGMIPPPSEKDSEDVHKRYETIINHQSEGIRGDEYYGYQHNLYDRVVESFHSFSIDLEKENVHLIKGLLQDTMKIDQPVAFAHIDVDWYDPVYTSLERIYPYLIPGGSIILDDYFDWESCRKATDTFLNTTDGNYELNSKYGSLKITKL